MADRKQHRMDRKLRRPSKPMMLAVNASIDGDKEEITRLMKEHELIPSELEQRLAGRNGNKYSFERKPRGSRQGGGSNDIVSMINETTRTAVLIQVVEKAQQILEAKPEEEVEKIRKAVAEVEKLREKYEEALEIIS